MRLDKDQVIGIVGGMGPEAGIALYDSILKQTEATVDQQHLSVVMMSFPGYIVDRTKYLEGETDVNPGYNIARIISKLEESGAGIIGIACNTSYAAPIFKVIKDELYNLKSDVRLLNMPEEVCSHILSCHPENRRIGVMSTNGTWKCGIYEKLLKDNGYETIIPEFEFQNNKIHRMIYDPVYGIKANPQQITADVESLLEEVLLYFRENGADAIILGCTELSKVLNSNRVGDMLIVDSTKVMAAALISEVNDTSNNSKVKKKHQPDNSQNRYKKINCNN